MRQSEIKRRHKRNKRVAYSKELMHVLLLCPSPDCITPHVRHKDGYNTEAAIMEEYGTVQP